MAISRLGEPIIGGYSTTCQARFEQASGAKGYYLTAKYSMPVSKIAQSRSEALISGGLGLTSYDFQIIGYSYRDYNRGDLPEHHLTGRGASAFLAFELDGYFTTGLSIGM
jgi:hypothetical protein